MRGPNRNPYISVEEEEMRIRDQEKGEEDRARKRARDSCFAFLWVVLLLSVSSLVLGGKVEVTATSDDEGLGEATNVERPPTSFFTSTSSLPLALALALFSWYAAFNKNTSVY